MTKPAVLIVDDDFLIRLHAADTLKDAGFEVVEASDAANALALLQEPPGFQLICTDVQMPGELDGIDLALRVLERHPDIRVIIMSAQSGHGDRLPSAPFLSKPFQASRLVDLARRELGAWDTARATPSSRVSKRCSTARTSTRSTGSSTPAQSGARDRRHETNDGRARVTGRR